MEDYLRTSMYNAMLDLAAFASAQLAKRGADHTGVCYTAALFY